MLNSYQTIRDIFPISVYKKCKKIYAPLTEIKNKKNDRDKDKQMNPTSKPKLELKAYEKHKWLMVKVEIY